MPDSLSFAKTRISDIVNGEFVEKDGQGFVKAPEGRELARIRVMATVVEKFIAKDGNYIALTLDDSTETIRAKFFQQTISMVSGIEVGDIIDIFGFLRQYEGETYIAPLILKKATDPNAEILRRLELASPSTLPEQEPIDIESRLLLKIEELDAGEGVEIEKLANSAKAGKEPAIAAIRNLLIKGDLYEPKKGVVKRID